MNKEVETILDNKMGNKESKPPKKLDIDSVLKSKAKKHYNKIPKVAINYLKRKVHQDELNYIIETYQDEYGSDFMKACVDYFNLTLHIKGEENIPKSGSFIFVSNHPLGGLDGICLAAKRQAIPSIASRTSYSSSNSAMVKETTLAPT